MPSQAFIATDLISANQMRFGLPRQKSRIGELIAAYDLPVPVYNRFTEGFDTKDLQKAKALLAEFR